jgi:hypothetical protein
MIREKGKEEKGTLSRGRGERGIRREEGAGGRSGSQGEAGKIGRNYFFSLRKNIT